LYGVQTEKQYMAVKTAQGHRVSGIKNLAYLPIFQLTGGAETERREFGQRLIGVCAQRSISGILVREEQLGNCRSYAVQSLARQYDLVLVDGELNFSPHQIQIGGRAQSGLDSLVWSCGNDLELEKFADRLVIKLDSLARHIPVWACILIGGKSSRMGRPKHLIEDEQKTTWLERTTAILSPLVDGLVVSGAGMLPKKLANTVCLADIPGLVGPLAGLLAAFRWQPTVAWLLVACDMPCITTAALQWLLADRRAGCWGRVPRLAESKYCEPLLAWYDFRAGQLFEEQMADGDLRISTVAAHPKIDTPVIPELLHSDWLNINTPEQLRSVSAGKRN
jgi:molybdopterin-guanine dinucleotide biosynthesis protein A